jgi:N-acetylglutamate synthase-like GNAT family acetyltransferase
MRKGKTMIIRKAKLSDSEAIHKLVNFYAKRGLMLARSRSSIYEYIRNYSVINRKAKWSGWIAYNPLSDLARSGRGRKGKLP